MGTKYNLIFSLLLIHAIYSHTDAIDCDVNDREADKAFPDIAKYSFESYELSVEYKLLPQMQFDFCKEYYDMKKKVGRLEYYASGNEFVHFYSESTDESFNIKGWNCETGVATATPTYNKDLMTDWIYEGTPLIKGPSAMLYYALNAWNNKDSKDPKMAYMGKTKNTIRGVYGQYWRRCAEGRKYHYYFSLESYDDAFGFDKKKIVPLRIEVFGDNTEKFKQYPQVYDFVTFLPKVKDETKLQVPIGKGCERDENIPKPKMPDLMGRNILIFGEAVYKDVFENSTYDYISSFMFAWDVNADQLAYYFTPWSNETSEKAYEANGLKHIIYDKANQYLYTNDYQKDICSITRDPSFVPTFALPGDNGQFDITDASMLYPNSEFSYVSDNFDRNLPVSSFEASIEDYQLGTRTVPKAIITRHYLKEDVSEENTVSVKEALTSITMKLLEKDKEKYTLKNELSVNFFGFTTTFPNEHTLFDVTKCFQNDTNYMWVTIGFSADKTIMAKVNASLPMFESELRNSLQLQTQLNAMRIPSVMIDLKDMIYASFMVLDKPPVLLDFLKPEDKTTIETDEVEGIKSLDGCATGCLETEDNCWGFALCGATCYYGVGATSKVASKDGCSLYRRFSNKTFEQSKEAIKNNLQRLVEGKQVKISVNVDDENPPLTLDATYIEIRSPGDDNEIFDLIGSETNPRLRVLKVGSKLNPNAGTTIKNLGQLRYDQCQRLCLDYQQCETVSYCLRDKTCVISTAYGDDIPKGDIIEDTFCNLLTRKYADQFERTPGVVLSKVALKTISVNNIDECAKACVKETSFSCQSFDNCPSSKDASCRLHAVHYLDAKVKESAVADSNCGHYSKKYAYGFRKESNKRVLNTGTPAATNITLEECAKLCYEYGNSFCYGYDYCEDKSLTQSSCTLLDKDPSTTKTTYSPICNHFLKNELKAPTIYTQGTAAWIGVVCFFVAAIIGVGITFGVGYWRANASR